MYLLQLEENGVDLEKFCREDGNFVKIDGVGTFTPQDIKYYYNKYHFLKNQGYFQPVDSSMKISKRLSADDIRFTLQTLDNICFEVTDRCNLDCYYCAYGKFYSNKEKRKTKDLDINLAKRFLQYLMKMKNTLHRRKVRSDLTIGFYGGEPLLNFEFIKELVAFSGKLLEGSNINYEYMMTTNGVLLPDYMDFIVKNDFKITISLDGDADSNGYRVFKNGTTSFETVFENIRALRKKYPGFFNRNVTFNAVLHQKNSIEKIYGFFNRHFDKTPSLSEVGPYWVKESKKEEFKTLYKNSFSETCFDENGSGVDDRFFMNLPAVKDLSNFLQLYTCFVYQTYNSFLLQRKNGDIAFTPTGTCVPFEKKLFVSVNGSILPCENVGDLNGLDFIHHDKIEIDPVKVAENYNRFLDNMEQCHQCFVGMKCSQCMFNVTNGRMVKSCNQYKNVMGLSTLFSRKISLFENAPGLYPRLLSGIKYE